MTTGNGTRRPTFPPSVWDVHDITVNNADRTNNFIEAFQILLSENQLLQEADAAQAASILLKHTIIITTLPNLRVLGVQLSSDLSLDKHVNVVSAKCFFQLRQLAASDVLWMTTLLLHSFMRSSRAESIIAAVSCLALRGRRPTSCNVSSTRQHESSRTRV